MKRQAKADFGDLMSMRVVQPNGDAAYEVSHVEEAWHHPHSPMDFNRIREERRWFERWRLALLIS